MDADEVEHIVELTVEAFVSTLPDNASGVKSSVPSPCVSFQTFRGDVRDSCVLPGVVLPTEDTSPQSLTLLHDVSTCNPRANNIACNAVSSATTGDIGILLLRESMDVSSNQYHGPTAPTGGASLLVDEQDPWSQPGTVNSAKQNSMLGVSLIR